MQERDDVEMKLFPRVLPVDIPLRSLSITASVRSSDVKKAKAMGNKILNSSYKSQTGPVVRVHVQCSTYVLAMWLI